MKGPPLTKFLWVHAVPIACPLGWMTAMCHFHIYISPRNAGPPIFAFWQLFKFISSPLCLLSLLSYSCLLPCHCPLLGSPLYQYQTAPCESLLCQIITNLWVTFCCLASSTDSIHCCHASTSVSVPVWVVYKKMCCISSHLIKTWNVVVSWCKKMHSTVKDFHCTNFPSNHI